MFKKKNHSTNILRNFLYSSDKLINGNHVFIRAISIIYLVLFAYDLWNWGKWDIFNSSENWFHEWINCFACKQAKT
jgi:hypothetical protein